MDKIETYLSEMKWPHVGGTQRVASSRLNIGTSARNAFCLGNVRKLDVFGKLVPSQYNKKHPTLFKLLKELMYIRDPGFTYTAIQLNANVKTKPHYDRHNKGFSYCFSLGNHVGGGLSLFENNDATTKPNIVNNNRKWIVYDGSQTLHGTAPHKSGNRYAIIYFDSPPRYRKQ